MPESATKRVVRAPRYSVGASRELVIREGVGDRASHHRLRLELREAAREVSRAVERLAGTR